MSTGIDLPPPPPPIPADDRRLSIPDAEFSTSTEDSQERACPNCGAPVHGPFCYACGQSEKGMIRHLTEVLSDLADIVLNVDSRVFRSLWDLYIRPGFLTTEYLAGRRARYVTPFRLFFFLTIIAFFAMQASIDFSEVKRGLSGGLEEAKSVEDVNRLTDEGIAELTSKMNLPGVDADSKAELVSDLADLRDERRARLFELALEGADSPEEVDQATQAAVATLKAERNAPGVDESSKSRLEQNLARLRISGSERLLELGLETARTEAEVARAVDEALAALDAAMDAPTADADWKSDLGKKRGRASSRAELRLEELGEDAAALAAGKPLPDRSKDKDRLIRLDLGGKDWHPDTNPFVVDWLPESMNGKLNSTAGHMEENIKDLRENPQRLLVSWFSVLPQTLFVVMPLFAVLLKIFYVFKRRLYMEHLLVALHSHAFIFMSILVILFVTMLAGLAEASPVLVEVIYWLRAAAWWWLFIYLLIMQKRVYRQGWPMTIVKYCAIGLCYTVFLSLALGVSLVIALAFA